MTSPVSGNAGVELVALSRTLGEHPARLTVWDEGSAAAALLNGRLAVTAARTALAGVTALDLVELEQARLIELVNGDNQSPEAIAEAFGELDPGVAPSADAFSHAYLLGLDGVGFAAHTQPVEVNQILASPRARQFADRRTLPGEVLSLGNSAVLVPFATGLHLAREIKRRVLLWRDRHKIVPRLVLVQNHGMFVLGNTPADIVRTTEITMKAAQIFIGAALMGGPVFLTPAQVSELEARGES